MEELDFAIQMNPKLVDKRENQQSVAVEWLVGFAYSSLNSDKKQYIEDIQNNLPKSAQKIRSELAAGKRKIMLEESLKKIYREYPDGDFGSIRGLLLPVIAGKPNLIFNKGFVKMGLLVMLGIHPSGTHKS